MPVTTILAVDCGAESGRVMAGHLDPAAGTCRLEEIHRFANGGRFVGKDFRWDWTRLVAGIEAGIVVARNRIQGIASIGIDTWGVDFGLLDAQGRLIEEPVHHRDARGSRQLAKLDATSSPATRFAVTGIRPMTINTIDQLHALAVERPELLAQADRLLFAPDLLAWRLCGVAANERSIASSSGCYAPGAIQPAKDLLTRLGIPARLFKDSVASGSPLGTLSSALGGGMQVLTSAGHDTAAAVAAVPATGEVCYISSGTWSLMGTLVDAPLLDERTLAAGLTNEVAWDGRIRLLRNIMGLWIVQECRRAFAAAGRSWEYGSLTAAAEAAPAPAAPLEVDDQRFLPPGTDQESMAQRVQGWYRERGLTVPTDDGGIVRAVLEGLAAAYGACFRDLEARTGRRFPAVHVIGGGSRNALLCRLTAQACGVPVLAGPVEATALGNILVQAAGLGLIGRGDLPGIVVNSETMVSYGP